MRRGSVKTQRQRPERGLLFGVFVLVATPTTFEKKMKNTLSETYWLCPSCQKENVRRVVDPPLVPGDILICSFCELTGRLYIGKFPPHRFS